jgi:hypothetical protein
VVSSGKAIVSAPSVRSRRAVLATYDSNSTAFEQPKKCPKFDFSANRDGRGWITVETFTRAKADRKPVTD